MPSPERLIQLGTRASLKAMLPTDEECAAAWDFPEYHDSPKMTDFLWALEVRAKRLQFFDITNLNTDHQIHVRPFPHCFRVYLRSTLINLADAAARAGIAFRRFLAAELDQLVAQARKQKLGSVATGLRDIIAGIYRLAVRTILTLSRTCPSNPCLDLPRVLAAGGQTRIFTPLA